MSKSDLCSLRLRQCVGRSGDNQPQRQLVRFRQRGCTSCHPRLHLIDPPQNKLKKISPVTEGLSRVYVRPISGLGPRTNIRNYHLQQKATNKQTSKMRTNKCVRVGFRVHNIAFHTPEAGWSVGTTSAVFQAIWSNQKQKHGNNFQIRFPSHSEQKICFSQTLPIEELSFVTVRIPCALFSNFKIGNKEKLLCNTKSPYSHNSWNYWWPLRYNSRTWRDRPGARSEYRSSTSAMGNLKRHGVFFSLWRTF